MARTFRHTTIAVLLTLVAATVGALAVPASAASQDVVLRVGVRSYPDSLNPFIGFRGISYEIWHLNYDGLTTVDPAGMTVAPGLAQSWEVSPDGKTWYFRLRRGVKWHDGRALTAADVAFTYNLIVSKRLDLFAAYTRFIDHATAVSTRTVKIVCRRPEADLVTSWIPILPKHIWKGKTVTALTNGFKNSPPIIGTGPFQVVAAEKGQYVRMRANPAYWGGRPKVDSLVFRRYTNGDDMVAALQSGRLAAVAPVPKARFADVAADPDLTAVKALVNGINELGFNCYGGAASLGAPVLREVDFRQALNWAVDKQALLAEAWAGTGYMADSVITAGFYQGPLDWHWSPAAADAYGFDIDRCKQLLDAGGYVDTNADGWRDYQGKTIDLRLATRQNSPESQEAGRMIEAWFGAAGVRVLVDVMDEGSLMDAMYNYEGDQYAPDFDMFIWGWYADYDPGSLLSYFTTGQIENWSDCAYSNPQYDALYVQQRSTLDSAERLGIIQQMQQILHRDSPYVVLQYPADLEAYDTAHWTGWVSAPETNGAVIMSSIRHTDSYRFVHPVP